MQIYRSLLTFFSSLSSSRYFKVPHSSQQQKKTYHKAIKQNQTEQSPNHLVRHHVSTATDQGSPSRNQDLGHPRSLIFRCLLAGEGRGRTRSEKTEYPDEYLLFNTVLKLSTFVQLINWSLKWRGFKSIWVLVYGAHLSRMAKRVVCYTAVFSVVTQRTWGALHDDSKNGFVTDCKKGGT